MARRWLGVVVVAALMLAIGCGVGEPMAGEADIEVDPCGTRLLSKEEFLAVAPDGMSRHANEVWWEYHSLFRRQPNVIWHGQILLRYEGVHPPGTVGISVHVTEKVDQEALPPEDRIPDCLEGVPIQVIEAPRVSPSPRVTEQVYCREQWETTRLPKEMEDLLRKGAHRLTDEERKRHAELLDELFSRIREVAFSNRELFSRQPNFFMLSAGFVGRSLPYGESGFGVKVLVTEIVPQWKLPLHDRIPCVIDGVPVEITTDDPRVWL